MNTKTTENLNTTAKVIASSLLNAAKAGILCKSDNDSEQSKFDSIKKSITISKTCFNHLPGINITNICKTTRQLNYLTTEVLHRLQSGGFYRLSVPTAKFTQPEFNFTAK